MITEITPDIRQQLRDLIDDVWNVVTESMEVPSTQWADKIIDNWINKQNDRI